MLTVREVERFLQFYPVPLSEIVYGIRDMIASVAPKATEEIRHGGFSYYFGERGGPVRAGICGIKLRTDYVVLFFPHGVFIPDPACLLSGSGKAMRHVNLNDYETVPWEDIRDLIEAHANFDPYSLVIY